MLVWLVVVVVVARAVVWEIWSSGLAGRLDLEMWVPRRKFRLWDLEGGAEGAMVETIDLKFLKASVAILEEIEDWSLRDPSGL